MKVNLTVTVLWFAIIALVIMVMTRCTDRECTRWVTKPMEVEVTIQKPMAITKPNCDNRTHGVKQKIFYDPCDGFCCLETIVWNNGSILDMNQVTEQSGPPHWD